MSSVDNSNREPPTPLYLIAVGIGTVMLLLLVSVFPERLDNLRRERALVPVVATVGGHRDFRLEGPPGGGRGGRGYPTISRQAQVAYRVGTKEYEAWVEFGPHLPVPERATSYPADPRPVPGGTVRLWYHPQTPAEPTAKEPQPLGDLFALVFLTVWHGIFILAGILGLVGLVQGMIAWGRHISRSS